MFQEMKGPATPEILPKEKIAAPEVERSLYGDIVPQRWAFTHCGGCGKPFAKGHSYLACFVARLRFRAAMRQAAVLPRRR